MKVAFTKPFMKDYQGLPQNIQKQIDEQIGHLLDNPRHPLLRALGAGKFLENLKDLGKRYYILKF